MNMMNTTTATAILNIAAYKFITLTDINDLRAQLRNLAAQNALKGTILLAPEGINMFMAGSQIQIATFLSALRKYAEFTDLVVN